MKIIVARNAGFCMGVRRALDIVLDRARRGEREIITYGPLIHNPQVVEQLGAKNIHSSRDFSRFSKEEEGFISAHGVSPEVRRKLKATGAEICDATCPKVIAVHRTIARYARQGYSTIIFGDRGHSEVEGLLGFTEGRGLVISSPEEAEELPALKKVILVSQTTQDEVEYEEVVRGIQENYPAAVICRTICSSTHKRQQELREMIDRADAMVVVGGRNSANTARLSMIARQAGLPVFQVEEPGELPLEQLSGYKTVAVTAGASTPNWLIQGVVDRIRDWSWRRKIAPLRYIYLLFSLLFQANLFIALGAAALTFATLHLISFPFSPVPLLLSFSAVFAIYNFDMLKKCSTVFLTQPSRYYFCLRHRKLLFGTSISALLAALAAGAFLGPLSFLLTGLTLALGLPLRISIFPFTDKRLKTFPGAKEISSSLGWGTLAVLIPLFSRGNPAPLPAAAAVTFLLVVLIMFVRSTLFDIRDVQGDRLVGRETLPVLIGKEKTKLLLGGVSLLLPSLLLLASLRGWLPSHSYYYLGLVAYMVGYLYLYHKRVLFLGLGHELVVDSQLILAGVIAMFLN